jgi:hypothetical protein
VRVGLWPGVSGVHWHPPWDLLCASGGGRFPTKFTLCTCVQTKTHFGFLLCAQKTKTHFGFLLCAQTWPDAKTREFVCIRGEPIPPCNRFVRTRRPQNAAGIRPLLETRGTMPFPATSADPDAKTREFVCIRGEPIPQAPLARNNRNTLDSHVSLWTFEVKRGDHCAFMYFMDYKKTQLEFFCVHVCAESEFRGKSAPSGCTHKNPKGAPVASEAGHGSRCFC